METMKLNVNRCRGPVPDEDNVYRPGVFGAIGHLWSSEPTIEITDCGPVAWWTCGRCPARVLYDPETEDGFPEEPVVVYPPSCFDVPAVELYTNATGITCPACASREARSVERAEEALLEGLRGEHPHASATAILNLSWHDRVEHLLALAEHDGRGLR